MEQLKAIVADPSTKARYRTECFKMITWINNVRSIAINAAARDAKGGAQ